MSNLLPTLETYLLRAIPPRSKTLAEMERYGSRVDFPIIGPVAGRLLYQQALLCGAK